ncbi:MAG: hypothetical protein ACXWTH_03000 [Methylosarcina sp.]
METKLTPENLLGWAYAKRFLSDLYGYEYLAEIWPERLGIRDLAALQAIGQDTPVYEAWLACLSKAAETSELITHTDQWFTAMSEPGEFWTGKKQTRFIIPPCYKEQYGDDLVCFEPAGLMNRTTAAASDFAAYLKKVGEAPSEYIAAWLDTFGIDTIEPEKAEIGSAAPEKELTKLEKQQAAILEAVKLKGFDPLAVPDGEKGTLRAICEADYPELFDGVSSFDNAWKATSRELFRMANHARYSKRGKT